MKYVPCNNWEPPHWATDHHWQETIARGGCLAYQPHAFKDPVGILQSLDASGYQQTYQRLGYPPTG